MQQQRAQSVAGHHLTQSHREGVEAVGGPKGGGRAGLLVGQHQSHQHRVGQHRGQRGKPAVSAPGGQQGGQQRGGAAHHDVQNAVGAEQVGDEAAHAQAPGRLRQEEGQDAQRLGKAALDRAVGDAEHRAEVAQDGVGRAGKGGGGEFFRGQVHGAVSSDVRIYQPSA